MSYQRVEFVSPHVGTWEADSDRHGHFTATQVLSDASGAFLGTVTVDGYPEVSEDEQTFVDDGSKVMIIIRDATGAIVQQMPGTGGQPVIGTRMAPGAPGFPTGRSAGTVSCRLRSRRSCHADDWRSLLGVQQHDEHDSGSRTVVAELTCSRGEPEEALAWPELGLLDSDA